MSYDTIHLRDQMIIDAQGTDIMRTLDEVTENLRRSAHNEAWSIWHRAMSMVENDELSPAQLVQLNRLLDEVKDKIIQLDDVKH